MPNLKALLAKAFAIFFTFLFLSGAGCFVFVYSTQKKAAQNPRHRDGVFEMAMQRPWIVALMGGTVLVLSLLVTIAAHTNQDDSKSDGG